MSGLNENDNAETAKALALAEEFSKVMNCFVMIVHHTGKDGDRGARGAGALLGNVDAMYELQRGEKYESMDTLLKVTKMKEGEEPEHPLLFQGRPYGDSIAFHRDWEWKPEAKPEKRPKEENLPDYLKTEMLAKALAKGPLIQAHLADTLSSWTGAPKTTISRALTKERAGRRKAWYIDEVWQIPEGFSVPDEQEEF